MVVKHRVVSVGCNTKKTHPIQKYYNINNKFEAEMDCYRHYLHAETQAIINANCKLNGATIYVYREDLNGNIAMCKPCKACMSLIKDMGIKNVVYTNYNSIEEFAVK